MTLKLNNFFRSLASTRFRIALTLKGLAYEYCAYVLRAGETRTPAYLDRNPQGWCPRCGQRMRSVGHGSGVWLG